MPAIHTFANSVAVRAEHLLPVQLDRYAHSGNLHEPIEEEWIATIVRGFDPSLPTDFVDVGAAIGYYCFYVHRLSPSTRLHAYEPDPSNRARLLENLPLNGSPQIDLRPEGVIARVGPACIMGTGFDAHVAPALLPGGVPVPATRIDDIVSRVGKPVDLLKMDVQGGEYEAMFGAERSLIDGAVRYWVVGSHSARLHAFLLDTFARFKHTVLFEALQVPHQPDGLVVARSPRA